MTDSSDPSVVRAPSGTRADAPLRNLESEAANPSSAARTPPLVVHRCPDGCVVLAPADANPYHFCRKLPRVNGKHLWRRAYLEET